MNFAFFLVAFWMGCALGVPDCFTLEPGTRMEIPGDCHRYIFCDGYGFILTCGKGKIYSKGKCDWPKNTDRIECGGVKTTPGTQTLTPIPATQKTPKPTEPTPTPKPRTCTDVGPFDPNYMLEIPDDCYSFIMCSHGTPHRMACPAGTVFNPRNMICDWPYNAGRKCKPRHG